jgi:hypothetical protein
LPFIHGLGSGGADEARDLLAARENCNLTTRDLDVDGGEGPPES